MKFTKKQLEDFFQCEGIIVIKGHKNWSKFKEIFFPDVKREDAFGIFSSEFTIGKMRIYFSDNPEFVSFHGIIKL